jgi:hypothetical protein
MPWAVVGYMERFICIRPVGHSKKPTSTTAHSGRSIRSASPRNAPAGVGYDMLLTRLDVMHLLLALLMTLLLCAVLKLVGKL